MVLPRILTSLFLVPVVLAVTWAGSLSFFLFVIMISLLSYWEFSLIAEDGGYPNHLGLGLIGSNVLLLSLYLDGASWGPLRESPGPLFIFMLWVFVLFIREFVRRDASLSLLRIITSVSGVLMYGFFLGHMMLVRDIRMAAGEGFEMVGKKLMFFLIFNIWIVDTGAWFVGRSMGRHALAPRISPKKTWEGAIGGTVLAWAATWIYTQAFMKGILSSGEAIFYSSLIAITAQVSDLIESFIKRTFDVKDSSRLLPGHGGILDRFDSFVFSAPFFYYFLIATGRFH